MHRILSAALALTLAGCSSTSTEEEPVELVAEPQSRRAAIDQELARLGAEHPWAGAYFYSPGNLTYQEIRLAPDAGYVHIHRTCTDLPHKCEGEVRWQGGELHLVPDEADPYTFMHFNGSSSFVPLRDGERRLLVPQRSVEALGELDEIELGWSLKRASNWFVSSSPSAATRSDASGS